MQASDIDRIQNNLYAAVNRKIAQKEEQVATRIQKAVEKVQKTFFKIMASEIIGADEAPALGSYTPVWTELSESYLRRKQKMKNKGFYTFTGKLEKNLLSANALSIFGTPVVAITQGSRAAGVYDTGNGVRSMSGKFAALSSNPSTVFKVNPFPDVVENINDPQSAAFEGEYLYKNKIGAKLTNYRGGRDRPILLPFMRWWLNVKMKQAIADAIGG